MSQREKRIIWKRAVRDEEKGIRWKEWECCFCWLPDSIAVPCLCVGCALNPRQLINPALLHSPRALSTVSAMPHNDPAPGWEVQSRPVGRATLALGTRPPYTPLQLCLELNMPRGDENSALSTLSPVLLHSRLFSLGPSASPDMVASLNHVVINSYHTAAD